MHRLRNVAAQNHNEKWENFDAGRIRDVCDAPGRGRRAPQTSRRSIRSGKHANDSTRTGPFEHEGGEAEAVIASDHRGDEFTKRCSSTTRRNCSVRKRRCGCCRRRKCSVYGGCVRSCCATNGRNARPTATTTIDGFDGKQHNFVQLFTRSATTTSRPLIFAIHSSRSSTTLFDAGDELHRTVAVGRQLRRSTTATTTSDRNRDGSNSATAATRGRHRRRS